MSQTFAGSVNKWPTVTGALLTRVANFTGFPVSTYAECFFFFFNYDIQKYQAVTKT